MNQQESDSKEKSRERQGTSQKRTEGGRKEVGLARPMEREERTRSQRERKKQREMQRDGKSGREKQREE